MIRLEDAIELSNKYKVDASELIILSGTIQKYIDSKLPLLSDLAKYQEMYSRVKQYCKRQYERKQARDITPYNKIFRM